MSEEPYQTTNLKTDGNVLSEAEIPPQESGPSSKVGSSSPISTSEEKTETPPTAPAPENKLVEKLNKARLAMEGPERTLKRRQYETEEKVETEKDRLESELAVIEKDKERLEINWVVLDNKQSSFKKLLAPIKEEEERTELEEDKLEGEEAITSQVLDRQKIEKARWVIQDKRKELEKKKWELENRILDTDKELEKNTVLYQELLDREEKIRTKLESLQYELEIVAEQIKLQDDTRKAEEEKQAIEAEQKRRVQEEQRQRLLEAEARQKKLEEIERQKKAAELARQKAEAEKLAEEKRQAEAEALKLKKLEEEQRQRAEIEMKRQEEMRRREAEQEERARKEKEVADAEKEQKERAQKDMEAKRLAEEKIQAEEVVNQQEKMKRESEVKQREAEEEKIETRQKEQAEAEKLTEENRRQAEEEELKKLRQAKIDEIKRTANELNSQNQNTKNNDRTAPGLIPEPNTHSSLSQEERDARAMMLEKARQVASGEVVTEDTLTPETPTISIRDPQNAVDLSDSEIANSKPVSESQTPTESPLSIPTSQKGAEVVSIAPGETGSLPNLRTFKSDIAGNSDFSEDQIKAAKKKFPWLK